jgi:large subunit ribosomal protein L15
MRLHDLQPRPGAKHRKKRLGCGESSGHGKTSGKGHKGQKARSGGGIRPSFEGGQMPIFRRLPKRGFNQAAFRDAIGTVNLDDLERVFAAGADVNEASLREAGLLRGKLDAVKLLGRGELTKKLAVEVDLASVSAREKVEKAGGSLTIRERRQPAAKEKTAKG